MKKKVFFKSSIGIIILIIVALIITLWLLKAPIIASYLSNKLGVNVSIGSIDVSKTGMSIRSFKINNPLGSRTSTAFSSKDIHVSYQWKELTADPNVIQEISMDDVFLGIEFYNLTGSQNNWTKILENVNQEKSKEDDNEVIIRRLIITNLSVQIRGKGLFESWEKVKDIDRIEFKNVSSKKGFPTGELIKEIFDEADIQKYLKEVLKPQNWLEKIFSDSTRYSKKVG
ncbi:MAG: hypothetical protein COT84_01060 [Chlamydiae bacterium CG10_big_fil_rev_8_21_14_0_10_35_9]|nr:MAG: hypothetical protein COT84_01060 [Chlamydiae bacterium CG10_big_fil_rev_8_21_14_0_10_35_9]